MAYRSIEELLDEVYAEAAKKTYAKSISVKVEGPILKCRIHLNDSFINVFFNEDTGTIAFTLIRGDRRIFGVDRDSLRGWHKHPRERERASRWRISRASQRSRREGSCDCTGAWKINIRRHGKKNSAVADLL